MIESRFWKEELLRIARELRRVKNPKKWSERLVCITERDIIIGFFIVRKMFEHRKVSDSNSQTKLKVKRVPRAESYINLINDWDLDKHYQLDEHIDIEKDVRYIANQFIHSKVLYLTRDDTRNWDEMIVVSDYDKKDMVWRVPITEIRRIFIIIGLDYPAYMEFKFNEETDDYDIVMGQG